MGFIRTDFGRIAIESRRESFYIHPSYGWKRNADDTDEEYDEEMGHFGEQWRDNPHPEFLIEDLDDLIAALTDYRDSL